MHLGVLKETKTPVDKRVALTPEKAAELLKRYPGLKISVEKSDIRSFPDKEYIDMGLSVVNDLSECDVLLGVKEVDINTLIPGKTYLFFSHTGKKQPYNRKLLQEIVKRNITLVDYEYMTDDDNVRLIAFGRWAGMIGAYNGLRAYGLRNGLYDLKAAHSCFDMREMFEELKKTGKLEARVLITGGGRVAKGAMETLSYLDLEQLSPEEYLTTSSSESGICQIEPWHYVKHVDGESFDLQHFYYYPDQYKSNFKPYSKVTDLFIPCHYWDPRAPVFLEKEDYIDPDFRIRVIADVSCDIGRPIASTIRASTIDAPFYGYDPETNGEGSPFDPGNITVMAVDNLPGELPRDASGDFASRLTDKILPSLINNTGNIIQRATIVKSGVLTENFQYLQDYLEGK